jgi:hypothetical protein
MSMDEARKDHQEFCDEECRSMSHDPKPVDEQPEAEIRGGNRPADYIPTLKELLEEDEWHDDEPPGGNDPDAK